MSVLLYSSWFYFYPNNMLKVNFLAKKSVFKIFENENFKSSKATFKLTSITIYFSMESKVNFDL